MTEREKFLIGLLRPEVAIAYMEYRADIEGQGIKENVYQTIRTIEEQQEKFAQGRTAQKSVGWHHLRRALDRFIWDRTLGRWDNEGSCVEVYLKANRIAEKHGFRQLGFNEDGSKKYIGGDKKIWDVGHLEYRGHWPTLLAAVEGEAPEISHLAYP